MSVSSQPQPPRPENNIRSTPQEKPQQRQNSGSKATSKKKLKATPPQPQTSHNQPQNINREVMSVPMMDMNFPVSEPIYIEEQEVQYYLPLESESQGLSGWWLVFTIFLIMITGFSAGYLIVRPLLQSQSQGN